QISVRCGSRQSEATASCAVEQERAGQVHLLGQGEHIRFGPIRAGVLRDRERLDLLGGDIAGHREHVALAGKVHIQGGGGGVGHGSMLVRWKVGWEREAVGPRWPWYREPVAALPQGYSAGLERRK